MNVTPRARLDTAEGTFLSLETQQIKEYGEVSVLSRLLFTTLMSI